MGIQGLTKLISDEAPDAIKEVEISDLMGRKVAIDASMAMYQFLIAVRSGDGAGPQQMLMNAEGEITSHIQGMLNRTIRLLSNGVKVAYVFDGKPPQLKGSELEKRKELREKAEKELKIATEEGSVEDENKFSRRLVRVTPKHNEDCKRLLKLMGVPVINAPGEAEASCAALARAGKVYGTGSEDMDSLTFNTPVLLRRMTFAAARNQPILKIDLKKTLEGLDITMDQFIDLCIMCGCDYCDSIKGIGAKKALAALRKHGDIEGVLKSLQDPTNKAKNIVIPQDWLDDDPIYKKARELFKKADVVDPKEMELKWSDPDEQGLLDFLVTEMGFNEARVKGQIERLKKSKDVHSQRRMDSFFTMLPSQGAGTKRKDSGKNGKKTPNSGKQAKRGRGRR